MNLWVILPVKSLQQTKSRLGHILSSAERAQLTQTLLIRTLHILNNTPTITEIVVVSQDPIVAKIAAQHDSRCVAEPPGGGLNGAVTTGAGLATTNGASQLLILPADLPFLSQFELDMLLTEAETAVAPPTLFLCSDEKLEGTNALILPAGVPFRFQYGRNSFHQHQQEAARLGLTCQIMQLPSLQFDLDTAQDYDFYTKTGCSPPPKKQQRSCFLPTPSS